MKSILITGSMGFIGAHVARMLAQKHRCIGIDIKPVVQWPNVANYRLDICDMAAVKKIFLEFSPDCVIHTAAEKSLIACEKNFQRATRINYDATLRLAELASQYKAKFIFISSDQVFDGKKGMYRENDYANPINAYGRLKIRVENAIAGVPRTAVCRTALVFGPIPDNQSEEFEKAREHPELKVQGYIVQHTYHRLLRGQSIHLPEDEFISPTHVDLLAKQLQKIIEVDASGILHCCGGERVSRHEFGLRIAQKYSLPKSGILAAPAHDHLRPKDVSLDCTYTEQILDMKFDKLDAMMLMPL